MAVGKLVVEGAEALRSPSAPSSMSSSSSRATSRMQSRACVDMPIFVCPRCRAGVVRRVSHTPRNQKSFVLRVQREWGKNRGNCTIFVVGIFEQWVDLFGVHAVAAARAPKEEMEGEARTDTELAVELRMLKKKVRKLEDQALPIPI
uniref:Uncharacterized protein n=1 Tax=Aegilops tauschii TaxID=37682 RepID=M8B1X8_AEGTA